ncbi:conjugal transfer pilus assembly protein TraV [Novosphingobium chloroacetimidivorans]|uniref:Conjugal transfer pilus assembly protein TraV n=1 Tax=Novosphingobium chloroacetimidivorans TaxID=1428314 RepID=A0A7W7KCY1_9SPHN|nr:hypothetical protein [Novosphingobium chloroacetimidivorans]MBB4860530.1 conjugal transfer pilus assembly protein TraV [Novosphingobium chloroacetimidivorans]
MIAGSPRAKRALAMTALLGAAAVAGCTTLGSNIKGDFTCAAPNGSCAPSSTIDDQAIASIQDRSSEEAMVPAGPYEVDDGNVPGMRVASVEAPRERGRSVPRTNGRVLRVVFPAYVDRYGQLHEKSAVQAEVDVGQVPQLAARASSERIARAADAGLFGAAENAPALLAFVPPASANVAPDNGTPASPRIAVQLPSFTAEPAPAPGKPAPGPTPIAAIKEEVARKLAQNAKLKAADFPATVE